jgi:hypothetical protein
MIELIIIALLGVLSPAWLYLGYRLGYNVKVKSEPKFIVTEGVTEIINPFEYTQMAESDDPTQPPPIENFEKALYPEEEQLA